MLKVTTKTKHRLLISMLALHIAPPDIHYKMQTHLYAYPCKTTTLNGSKIMVHSYSYRIETPVSKNDCYNFQNFS